MSRASISFAQFYYQLGHALNGQIAGFAFMSDRARDIAFKQAKRELSSLRYPYRVIRKTHTLRLGEPYNGELRFVTVTQGD